MKKSTQKTVNYLKQYIGQEILRTKPANGDWSYSSHDPILLVGFTSDGRIRYRHTGFDAEILGDEEYILSIKYTDRNWITYKKAIKAKGNKLNKWKGKKIKRNCPTILGDFSYINDLGGYTLISASKYHMVIIDMTGSKRVLGPTFVKIEDWELAE